MNKNTIPYFTIFGKDFLAYTYDLTDSQIGKIVKQLCRGSIGLSMNSPKGCEEIFEKLKNSLLEDKEKYFKKIQQKQSASNARWNAPELQPQSECNPNPNPNPNPNQLDNKKTKEKKEVINDDWQPSDSILKNIKDRGYQQSQIEKTRQQFINTILATNNKYKYKNFDRAFLNWITREQPAKEENEFLRGL